MAQVETIWLIAQPQTIPVIIWISHVWTEAIVRSIVARELTHSHLQNCIVMQARIARVLEPVVLPILSLKLQSPHRTRPAALRQIPAKAQAIRQASVRRQIQVISLQNLQHQIPRNLPLAVQANLLQRPRVNHLQSLLQRVLRRIHLNHLRNILLKRQAQHHHEPHPKAQAKTQQMTPVRLRPNHQLDRQVKVHQRVQVDHRR